VKCQHFDFTVSHGNIDQDIHQMMLVST